MPRGPKHLKRVNAPKLWLLDKLSGVFAPKPSAGPHKGRESMPLVVLLRNRLKYALTARETQAIVKQRLLKVDGKVRTNRKYPVGFQDVITIEKTNENFRILYDVKGRFVVHPITPNEAKYKLLKVKRAQLGDKKIPYIATHDGRTFRYPDPIIKVNDTVKYDMETGKISDVIKFDIGNLVMITGGRNLGRVGVIVSREKHPGSFEIIHVKDAAGQQFATRLQNVFAIGKSTKSAISLPRKKGIKRSVLEESELAKKQAAEAQAQK